MANGRERSRHFIIEGFTETEPYRSRQQGARRPVVPERDRGSHGGALQRQVDALRQQAAAARVAQEAAGLDDSLGLQVEFESFPEIELAFESLARERSGIELLNVRHVGDRTHATVFVPVGKLGHFERLAALGGGRPNGLFFAGDLGQRIFQTPFSWRSLGVDVRGRSHTLRINYRTSHQIRRQADRLLPPELADVDGNAEQRGATVSVFNGPAPELRVFDSPEEETEAIAGWLRARQGEGYAPQAIGVFVRSEAQVERALSAVRAAGLRPVRLDVRSGGVPGSVAVGTMHLAKGLEFRAVVVAACDDEVIPLQGRIEHVADEADLEEVYSTERHLLYVACTRARDRLLVTGVEPASEFLDDLRG